MSGSRGLGWGIAEDVEVVPVDADVDGIEGGTEEGVGAGDEAVEGGRGGSGGVSAMTSRSGR